MGSVGMSIGSDLKLSIISIMKEMSKKNNMVNKEDIYTVIQN